MATFRDKVVTVTLVYGATSITETEFDIPLILTGHNVTDTDAEVYTSSDDILAAGFSESSPAYIMAVLLFEGLMPPEEVVIGRRPVDSWKLAPNLADTTEYAITLKSGTTTKEFSFTSGSSATLEEISTGLVDLINEDTTWNTYVLAAADSDFNILVTPASGKFVDISYTSTLTPTVVYTNSITDDITAVVDENDTWFWLLSDSHVDADIEACASYAEQYDKIYAFSSQDTDIVNAVSGNILATLGDTGYNNTWFTVWMSTADSVYPEASAVAQICSATPGTTTMHGKTLVGVTLEKLSTTQETNIVSQNGNIYRKDHGTLFYRDGFVVSGLYVDYISHALWFKARVDESLFTLFKQQSMLGGGVRATSAGLALIRQAVQTNPIQVGITNGSIANEVTTSDTTGLKINLKPTIYLPSRADMTTSQINERLVDGMVIEYVYAGFFHYVKVQVNVLTNRTASTANSSASSNTTTVS